MQVHASPNRTSTDWIWLNPCRHPGIVWYTPHREVTDYRQYTDAVHPFVPRFNSFSNESTHQKVEFRRPSEFHSSHRHWNQKCRHKKTENVEDAYRLLPKVRGNWRSRQHGAGPSAFKNPDIVSKLKIYLKRKSTTRMAHDFEMREPRLHRSF
jgi:hypothetical protein